MTLTQSLQLASERLSAALNGGQALILSLGIAAVMSLAGLQVAQGTMTIGDLVLANGLILQLSGPLQVLPLKSSWKLLCLWCFSDLCKFQISEWLFVAMGGSSWGFCTEISGSLRWTWRVFLPSSGSLQISTSTQLMMCKQFHVLCGLQNFDKMKFK